MREPFIALTLIALLALGSSASLAQVAVTDSVTGITTELALPLGTRPHSKGKIARAATLRSWFGMGIGHWILEDKQDGQVFRRTQLLGLAAATVGLGMGFGGQENGKRLFYPGVVVYAGSRVWEFVDVFASSSAHNAKVADDRRALAAARQPRLGVRPIIGRARQGFARSLTF